MHIFLLYFTDKSFCLCWCLSLFIPGGFGIINMIKKIENNEYMGFEDLCKYDAWNVHMFNDFVLWGKNSSLVRIGHYFIEVGNSPWSICFWRVVLDSIHFIWLCYQYLRHGMGNCNNILLSIYRVSFKQQSLWGILFIFLFHFKLEADCMMI